MGANCESTAAVSRPVGPGSGYAGQFGRWVGSRTAPELADYVSPLFERLCQRALPGLIDRQFRDIGQWWFKEHELDILGLTADGLVAGECKFTAHSVSEGVLVDVEHTASEVRWSKAPADGETMYVLFSRSGYTDDRKSVADTRDDIRLFELSDLLTTTMSA